MAVEMRPEDYDELMFIIGGRGELTAANSAKMAAGIVAACKLNKHGNVTLSIDGYDDDPREIWEIPECINYITMTVAAMEYLSSPEFVEQIRTRLTPESAQWRRTS